MLASELDADLLAILTNVDQVQRDYGKPTAKALSRITLDEARNLIAEKQFPAGSMGPKVEAAVQFAEESPDPSVEAFMSDLSNYVYAPADPATDVHEKED